MKPRGVEVLDALRGLKGYDNQGNLLGSISGGTSNREPNEPLTEHNTVAFIGRKEIHLEDICFEKGDIKEQLSKWTAEINRVKQLMVQEEYIIAIEYLAKNVVSLCQNIQTLEEYEKSIKEKILN